MSFIWSHLIPINFLAFSCTNGNFTPNSYVPNVFGFLYINIFYLIIFYYILFILSDILFIFSSSPIRPVIVTSSSYCFCCRLQSVVVPEKQHNINIVQEKKNKILHVTNTVRHPFKEHQALPSRGCSYLTNTPTNAHI